MSLRKNQSMKATRSKSKSSHNIPISSKQIIHTEAWKSSKQSKDNQVKTRIRKYRIRLLYLYKIPLDRSSLCLRPYVKFWFASLRKTRQFWVGSWLMILERCPLRKIPNNYLHLLLISSPIKNSKVWRSKLILFVTNWYQYSGLASKASSSKSN